jgi:protease PrsW
VKGLLFFLSVLPCLLILWYVYVRDKHERETWSVYLLCLFYGALSSWLAYYTEPFMKSFFEPDHSNFLFTMKVLVGIALCEELCKYLFLRIFLYNHKEFNEPYDGIVYAVTIALGFAAVENVLYVVPLGSWKVALWRMVTAVPAHAVFGGMMGYYFALSKFSNKYKTWYLVVGITLASCMHGLYDYFILVDVHPKWTWVSILLLLFFEVLLRKMGTKLLKRSGH